MSFHTHKSLSQILVAAILAVLVVGVFPVVSWRIAHDTVFR